MQKIFITLTLALLFAGCATANRTSSTTGANIAPANGVSPSVAGADGVDSEEADNDGEAIGTPVSKQEMSSSEIENQVSRAYHSQYGELNLKSNTHVEKWISYFQGRGRSYMEVYLQRSSRYLPMMKNTLRENGLPEDLVYIALIESGFSPTAHSHASAVGYWQFIKGTGRRYGLNVNTLVDERRDPVLSTRAAAEYFKALYNLFGSWYLAMASYNVGENRVKNVVMKHYTRDFWELVRKRKLPAETLNYVPKFIAAAIIAKDPTKYGFTNIEYQPALAYDTVAIEKPISLDRLGQQLSVTYEDMKLLNPKYKTDFVPVYKDSETLIRVPVGMKTQAVAAIPACEAVAPRVMVGEFDFYRIRRGDSLSTVARRHGTSVDAIRRLNGLSPKSILRVGQKIKVPDRIARGEASVNASAERKQAATTQVESTEVVSASVHVVRRGENLTTIAKRYNLTVAELVRINNLSPRRSIKAGDRIKVREQKDQTIKTAFSDIRRIALKKDSAGRKIASKSQKKVHVVRRGENLAMIARNYNVSLNKLVAVNDLKSKSPLFVGKQLVIPTTLAIR